MVVSLSFLPLPEVYPGNQEKHLIRVKIIKLTVSYLQQVQYMDMEFTYTTTVCAEPSNVYVLCDSNLG